MLTNPIKSYTYRDYLTFANDERVEIIDGTLYNMSSPSVIHQTLSIEVSSELRNYIKATDGSCKVFTAPFDVILKNNDETVENSTNIVIPDISVICDNSKLSNGKNCVGSPDMIIEIVSPSNASNDYVRKLYLYEKYKVKEYWIISPSKKNIHVYVLNSNGQYDEPKVYTFKDKVNVNIYESLAIDFNTLDLE